MKKSALLVLLCAIICSPVLGEWQMKKGPLMTKWADKIDINKPFPEYPRPQMERDEWLNLNGIWQFQAGKDNDNVPVNKTLSGEILVPFVMESAISGVMEHHERAWYRRTFDVPKSWGGKKILLHLDAVDWESEIYVNGRSVTVHKGGYDPIVLDITRFLRGDGPQELIVRIFDPTDMAGYPRGKQTLHPGGIMYTSVSGIWQSVWLEPVAAKGIKDLKMTPDIDAATLSLRVNTFDAAGQTVDIKVKSNGKTVASSSGAADADLAIKIPDQKLWSPEDPFLYDLEVALKLNGKVIDTVTSYFGMRKISLGKDSDGVVRLFLNNEFLFHMGPLDQGWWPDGLYTAPTDEALKYDIVKTKEFGFNMIRKHIKVEPARWYYWADKVGIMVWQDMPSANSYTGRPQPLDKVQYKLELDRMIDNLWNCPSIVSWVIFNEQQGRHDVEELVNMVKAKDSSRLVNQDSGGGPCRVGDIYDVHSYPAPGFPNPDAEVSKRMARVCGEYGGIGFVIKGHVWNPNSRIFQYSNTSEVDAYVERYGQYCNSLLDFKVTKGLSGAVYTEITDVENECNGLMTYDRVVKAKESDIAKLNQMVVTADLKTGIVLATSRKSPAEWAYTTSKPADDWFKTNFNDSSWSKGKGGFGTDGTPNAKIGTTWNTSDIWLRREVKIGSYTKDEIAAMCFNLFHDEDYEIYINGVLAGSGPGYTTNYVVLPMTKEGKAAIIPNGKNVIAIHCKQTMGGQFIDTGISIFQPIFKD